MRKKKRVEYHKEEMIKNIKLISKESSKVFVNEETGIKNYLINEHELVSDNSVLTHPQKRVINKFFEGDMNFNINWTDIIKFFYIQNFIEDLKLQKPKILDIGCCWSDTRILCWKNHINIEYHGVDIQYSKIKSSCVTFTNNNSFFYLQNLSNFDTTFFQSEFDVCLLLDVIEHLHSKQEGFELIKKTFSLLKSGSHMIITTPNNYIGDLQFPKEHIYEYSISELLEFCKQENFNIVKTFGLSLLWDKTNSHLRNKNNTEFAMLQFYSRL